ncbi:hypothetical protein Q2295_07370 [Leptospira interrogans]|uniref:Uncharacterized protein n=1 Tax=Leptospira interrogans serovar Pomona TaxID=44276 RepID=A0AA41BIR0_LEPIR|nr:MULTISPECIES: hypothetical protein [Leptospira]EJO79455.1 hypothetical protein LEP1GSC045_2107 [Leptospira interrogans serovar Pomona str. Kennewicki LC82-25]EKN98177.1 hypothetical protein LEP1GSC014_1058 [Leptospira interrogans serovar Pomona str. Pomona]EKO88513.1 hypothetical protein LEP1GSC009_0958 [Leptospira interrogans serovar Grippotyphosa str. Andaman]EKP84336.1 hypothetical protein LEP1GSC020_4520 [Leptospira interrogans serovar Grippotyphosa str. 2006006986]EKR27313.1 hypothetic
MQTGIGRRQIILITFGAFLTTLLVFGIYLFIFRSPNVLIIKNSKTKIDLTGTWRVSTIVPMKQIRFINDKEAILLEESSEIKLYLMEDGEGLQLRRKGEETPTGYFLFRELKKDSWQGLWEDNLVVLKRISANN